MVCYSVVRYVWYTSISSVVFYVVKCGLVKCDVMWYSVVCACVIKEGDK